jgi:hypothetical protein
LEAHWKALKEEVKRQNAAGWTNIRLIEPNYEEDDGKVDEENITAEQIAQMRHCILTENRSKSMNEMQELITGGECLFNTQFSYQIIEAYDDMDTKYKSLRQNYKKKFDMLLGFTYTLNEYDFWMDDHEVGWGTDFGGSAFIKGLARKWKA